MACSKRGLIFVRFSHIRYGRYALNDHGMFGILWSDSLYKKKNRTPKLKWGLLAPHRPAPPHPAPLPLPSPTAVVHRPQDGIKSVLIIHTQPTYNMKYRDLPQIALSARALPFVLVPPIQTDQRGCPKCVANH